MRHALITPLASRDGSVDKDEKLVNCYGEQDPVTKETFVYKRAGIDEGDAVITGNDFYGQGAFSYGDDLFVIIDDILFKWDYVGGLDYGGDWVYVFGSQSGAGGSGGGAYYTEGSTQDYEISVTYDVGDSVIYEGVKYYAQGPSTGQTPGSNPLWSTTPPGANTYQGTISWGGTGGVCASIAAAGYSAYLACPYNSCPNRRTDTNSWITYDSMSGNNIRCHAYGVFSPNYCAGSINDFGVGTYGTVTQLS